MNIINLSVFLFFLAQSIVFSDEVESNISTEERLVLKFFQGIESGKIPLDTLPKDEDITTELIGGEKNFNGDPRILLRDFLIKNKNLFLAGGKINNKSIVQIKPLGNLRRFEIFPGGERNVIYNGTTKNEYVICLSIGTNAKITTFIAIKRGINNIAEIDFSGTIMSDGKLLLEKAIDKQ